MFSGIIASTGRITHLLTNAQGLRLTVETPVLDLSDVATGDFIAHNGVCLSASYQEVDVSRETLDCTVGLNVPGDINLEEALRLPDRLSGLW